MRLLGMFSGRGRKVGRCEAKGMSEIGSNGNECV